MKIKNAKFIISNTDYRKCPKENVPEFPFIGRSNVGKSSLINSIVNNKNLAKTSSKPGKTQLINHFMVNEEWYLVDLPGFGYAKTSKKNRKQFESIIANYLINRKNIICLFVLIDSRHKPQSIDQEFLKWLAIKKIPFIIVFTKIDKLSKSSLVKNIKFYKSYMLEEWEALPEMILTSSINQNGIEEIKKVIERLNKLFKTST